MLPFIIIKGQPKALQIERFKMGNNGVYDVKFKNSQKTYHYRYNDVIYLNNAVWHDHMNCKIYITGRETHNVEDILSFQQGNQTHWRITFNNGHVKDFLHGNIQVAESCLTDNIAKNTFEYLKRIAHVNELGIDEEHGGILSTLYEQINFIDNELSVVPYLNPEKSKSCKHNAPKLIFPFGCNSSQVKAVTAAFENQISVIQGPPGTGKTQTILNIITNILIQGKSVIVVSNNNSATTNVLEKMEKYGLHFIAAPLGRRENKEEFIKNQPTIPDELQTWELPLSGFLQEKRIVADTLRQVKKVFSLQESLASAKQELRGIELEWEHFKQDNKIQENIFTTKVGVKPELYLKLWFRYQAFTEENIMTSTGVWGRIVERLKWVRINFTRKYLLGIKTPFDKSNILPTIIELQSLYYLGRIRELSNLIENITGQLASIDANVLSNKLASHSMKVLKSSLYEKYHKEARRIFSDVSELRLCAEDFLHQYPVILSTTFSARTSVPGMIYDYLIMDEASQVSIDTGALALTCAKNAVIVGDSLQLPNVVTENDKLKLDAIFDKYKVSNGYNCANYSFLQSVCSIIPNVTQTLLKEHYRCHPKIINFCNQRFYGGNLIIMTEDHNDKDVMMAIKTAPGHHTRGHFNQREIDVIKQEVLPTLKNIEDIGIITPYNQQVDEFHRQIPTIEAATIHEYQGREKDTIIMSVVDDQITEFADDANLLNVAISRAKKQFCLVVSGNKQDYRGNIMDLIDYIAYNNFSLTESKINSIFDYLYSNYTTERMSFLAKHRHISEYDSENLTFSLIENILHDYSEFSHLGIFCHTPLRCIVKDWSLLQEDERKYISHYSTHIDFLIVNHVTKKPILAIETDGYNYHNENTEQHLRDEMKNHILEIYGLPLLRLSTIGSKEKEKILSTLSTLV
jgi:superfamily I DNA and/or RNA helicase